MTQEEEWSIEFRVAAKELASALRGLRPARPRGEDAAKGVVGRVSAALGQGEVSIPGASRQFDAEVSAEGAALVPWRMLEVAGGVASTYKAKEVTVSIGAGCLRLEQTSWESDRITVVSSGARQPVLPIGATLLDTIIVGRTHTREELESWGLQETCEKAEEEARRIASDAASSLAQLGVRREDVEALTEAAIQSRCSREAES